MPHYTVTAEFDNLEVKVVAKSEREACKKVRQKIREGKLRAKLRPSRFSGSGSNITAERDWRYW